MDLSGYTKLPFDLEEFNPLNSLSNGQCFDWYELRDRSDVVRGFVGVYPHFCWEVIVNEGMLEKGIFVRLLTGDLDDELGWWMEYVQAHVPLSKEYSKWIQLDCSKEGAERLKEGVDDRNMLQDPRENVENEVKVGTSESCDCPFHTYPGVRVLKQDMLSCVISFITSQNMSVPRILSLIRSLRTYMDAGYVDYSAPQGLDLTYPKSFFVGQLGKAPRNPLLRYCHTDRIPLPPTIEHLRKKIHPGLLDDLKALGFGYRARYLNEFFRGLVENDILLTQNYFCTNDSDGGITSARELLLQVMGIGPKVADCVLLYTGHGNNIVPIDTNVISIGQRLKLGPYMGCDKVKSSSHYIEMQESMADRYGVFAGWAQSVLFMHMLKNPKLKRSNLNKTKKLKNSGPKKNH